MTREEKLKLAEKIRQGMVVEPVVPDGFEQYLERVECCEKWIPVSAGTSHIYILREKGKDQILPLYVNIHGGGFVRPHLDRDRLFASRITCETGCVTIDIDYRLAPEYPYPAAVYECYDVVKWAIAHAEELQIDPDRVVVGGHSSGGTLTAALALKANMTQEFQLKMQILDYPPMDMYTDPEVKQWQKDIVINPERARAYNALYVENHEQAREPLASPLFASQDMLRGLPETLIITAGEDSLRFEAEQYGQNLADAGVAVTVHRFEGCRHGFITHCQERYQEGHELYISMMRKAFESAEKK